MRNKTVATILVLVLGMLLGCGDSEPRGTRQSADVENARDEPTGPLFLTSFNATSNRHAVLEDDGQSCWLYLTEVRGQRPEKDCFVYSPIQPVEEPNLEAMASGAPPVLPRDLASAVAVLVESSAKDFSFVWSEDGESVVVMHRGTARAMIVSGERRGYSRALAKASPIGKPWDDSVFVRYFGRSGD
jgi:hypothetical protein